MHQQTTPGTSSSPSAPVSSSIPIPVLPSLKDIKAPLAAAKESSEEAGNIQTDKKATENIPVNEDALRNLVKKYAEMKKSEGKMFEYLLFNEHDFTVVDDKIVFKLESDTSKNQLESAKGPFIEFLRTNFNRSFIIEGELVESKEEKKMLYSSSDKFSFLVEKYPALEDLKKRLGLEIEY